MHHSSGPPSRPPRPPRPGRRRGTGAPAAPVAAPAARAALVYWERVGTPAPLHRGPLGAESGEVPAGAVLRERRRYRDPFGDCWAAASAADGGGLVWVKLSGAAADAHTEGPAHWRRVYDAREADGAPAEQQEQQQEQLQLQLQLEQRVRLEGTRSPPCVVGDVSDAAVFERCWRRAVSTHDWNAAYQELLEQRLFGEASAEVLHEFMQDFTNAAVEAAMVIVQDFLRPTADRVGVPVGVAGAFLCDGLLVRVAVDKSGCDARAWQMAAQAHLARQVVAIEGPKRLLCSPPCALVTFAGFRMSVSAVPPVSTANIISCARLERDGHAGAPESIRSRVADFGRAVGLRSYYLSPRGSESSGGAVEAVLPLDAAVIAGFDRRLYLLDVGHILPAMAIVSGRQEQQEEQEEEEMKGKWKPGKEDAPLRFRPEFLFALDRPLCCGDDAREDSVSIDRISEAEAERLGATDYVRDGLIPAVAAVLGMRSPVTQPRLAVALCTLCERAMDDELRFVVCRGDDACCRICTHCYTQRLSEHSEHSEHSVRMERPDPMLFADAVRCGSTARRPKGLVLEPSVTEIFHANGLNMRFLPFVYNHISEDACFAVAHYCEVEMIARAAVRVLRERLRRTAQSVEEVHDVCHKFLFALLQSSGAAALDFWSQDLGPTLQRVYGVQEPFDTAELDVELLYSRVAELSGIRLDPESVASIHSAKPFLRLAQVQPIVKVVQPPHVVDEASRERMRGALIQGIESILLFWIGFSVTELENDDEEPLKQPFYMAEKGSWIW